MFDEHLNRQHRLSHFVRGPEWGFAIPQGDLDALEAVMRRSSTFWNGVGSLLVPVRADGQIPALVKMLMQIRPLDACYMHEGLGDRARSAVQDLTAGVPFWEGFDRDELHPLDLAGARADSPQMETVMEQPTFRAAGARRAALAIWGQIRRWDLFPLMVQSQLDCTLGIVKVQVRLAAA